ncbi:MAG: hypothetical protein ACRD2W_02850 [Acidimicrobiales bacterium]
MNLTRSKPTVIGYVQTFAALTPIIPGHEQALHLHLGALSPEASPMSRVAGTHYARWVVIPRLHYEGHPQKPDTLKSQYLLFSACFDGQNLGPYLASLQYQLDSHADAIWGHCVGYGGLRDLTRYLLHNRIKSNLFLADQPMATTREVHEGLEVRRRLQKFVMDNRSVDNAAALLAAWRREFSDG